MILKQSSKEPNLVGIMETDQDYLEVQSMVNILNGNLVDSGFEKYQYETVRRGNKLYIERVGA